MKTKDVPVLKQKVLDILPITQPEMWKTLGINSREGSSLVGIMLKENLLTRRKKDGIFLLERINGNGKVDSNGNGKVDDIGTKDEDVKRRADEDRSDEDLKRRADEDLKRRADEDLKRRADEDLKRRADEDLKRRADDEVSKKNMASDQQQGKKRYRDSIDTKHQILNMLPMVQSDIWKRLNIDSSACARLIDAMLEEKLIIRTKLSKSFIIEKVHIDKVEKKKIDYTILISGENKFSPCCGCSLVCDAGPCVILSNWLIE